MNNIILVDKPAGWTSFDVVAKLRGAIRAKYAARGLRPTKRQLKVGHAGTLDPFATGLLVILLGDACARATEFLKLDKTYEATFRLGQTSSTGDPEGVITKIERSEDREIGEGTEKAVSNTIPTREAVLGALKGLTGHIEQTPPVFSAIKVNGERAYNLARKGHEVTMLPRTVTIYELELLNYTYPDVTVRTAVSSGTYIRTLAEDVGRALGTGAYCLALRRIQVGSMTIDDAFTVEAALRNLEFEDSDYEQDAK